MMLFGVVPSVVTTFTGAVFGSGGNLVFQLLGDVSLVCGVVSLG